jgi:KaiC/GvpD/RAD55 family RecA-like ATPase
LKTAEKNVNRMSLGPKELDRLTGGGLRPGDCYLLEVEPGTGELSFIASYIEEGLKSRNFLILVTYDRPWKDLVYRLTELGVDTNSAMTSGQMIIGDLYGQGHYDPEDRGPVLHTDNPDDPNSALRMYYDLARIGEAKTNGGDYARTRIAVMSISTEMTKYKFEQTIKLVRKGMEAVKDLHAVNLSILNPRMFDETIVASFEHLYDGVIALATNQVKGSYQRSLRVKESPNDGF